jgi:DNA-directed RNA polymerase specialized sigma subunit
VNNVGDLLEFNGELTHGDPISLVAQFRVPTTEERNAKIEELREQMKAISGNFEKSGEEEVTVEEVADAVGVSMEEAAEIHQKADSDGDGSVSIDEILKATEELQIIDEEPVVIEEPEVEVEELDD